MDGSQYPTPDEARASLDAVDETRNAVATTTRRSVWPVAALAVAIGACVGLLSLSDTTAKTLGWIILVVGLLGFSLVRHRLARAQGEVFDNRFIGAAALRFVPGWIAIGILTTVQLPTGWQPWYAIGLGLITAGVAYMFYRWADNYRAKRLAIGDYNHSNLL